MQQVINNTLAKEFMQLVTGGQGGSLSGLAGLFGGSGLTAGGGQSAMMYSESFGPGYWNGGKVRPRRFTLGGDTGAVTTRDSVPALLAPGEVVMKQSAVSLLGADNLENLNAMGNSRLSQSPSITDMTKKRDPDQVHVWVTAPDQKPTLGANDVLHVIGDDIMRGGQTKQLIKSVMMGQ
jgi:hypothetical protein